MTKDEIEAEVGSLEAELQTPPANKSLYLGKGGRFPTVLAEIATLPAEEQGPLKARVEALSAAMKAPAKKPQPQQTPKPKAASQEEEFHFDAGAYLAILRHPFRPPPDPNAIPEGDPRHCTLCAARAEKKSTHS